MAKRRWHTPHSTWRQTMRPCRALWLSVLVSGKDISWTQLTTVLARCPTSCVSPPRSITSNGTDPACRPSEAAIGDRGPGGPGLDGVRHHYPLRTVPRHFAAPPRSTPPGPAPRRSGEIFVPPCAAHPAMGCSDRTVLPTLRCDADDRAGDRRLRETRLPVSGA
jgi:hypothetical protein